MNTTNIIEALYAFSKYIKKYKNRLFFIPIILLVSSLQAQHEHHMQNHMDMNHGDIDTTMDMHNNIFVYDLYGKLIDEKSKKTISFASITLIAEEASSKNTDTIIAGTFSEQDGSFRIDTVSVSKHIMQMKNGNKIEMSYMENYQYKLKIKAYGYADYEMPINFDNLRKGNTMLGENMAGMTGLMEMTDHTEMQMSMTARNTKTEAIDLGNIALNTKSNALGEVRVYSNKMQQTLKADRRSFDVSNIPLAENGTAVDVMKNIPSTSVDVNGNILLRNATPAVYIDGKPTDLTLDMLPADIIDKVQVITSPSAQYDANTATGVINIITKKKNKVKIGYFGVARLGVDRFGLPTIGSSISFYKQQFNFNITLYGLMKQLDLDGFTQRKTATDFLQQNEKGSYARLHVLNIRPNFDWYITNRTTLSVGASFNIRNTQQYVFQDVFLSRANSNIYMNRNGSTQSTMYMPTGNISLEHLFPEKDRKLTVDLSFYGGTVTKPIALYQRQWDTSFAYQNPISQYYQKGSTSNDHSRVRLQVDYITPIKKSMEISTGAIAQLTYMNEITRVFRGAINPSTTELLSLRNNYLAYQHLYAGYFTFTHHVALPNDHLLTYQLGLRGELFTQDLRITNATSTQKYYIHGFKPFEILYPSVFISYKMPASQQEFQLNYTRRATRPTFVQTNPYVNYLDSLNVLQGNPNLQSAFTNYAELNYNKTLTDSRGLNHNLFVALYANYTTGAIVNYQYTTLANNIRTVVTSFTNADQSIVSGIEISPQIQLFSWWQIQPSFNLYYSKINTNDQQILNSNLFGSNRSLWTYYAKLSFNFLLPHGFDIQLIGDYYSKRLSSPGNAQSQGAFSFNLVNSSQGYILPYYGVDFSIRKSFKYAKKTMLRPLSITLNASDLFGTRYNRVNIFGSDFTQYSKIRVNPFYINITFSYRFGKLRKGSGDSDDSASGGMGGAMMGM